MEMPRERKLQRRDREATETRARSGKDEMNLLVEFPTISLAAGKIGEEAIIVELLLSLPIKTLIRFKCVCKSWRSFISDHQFTRSHLNRCMLQNPNSFRRLLFGVDDPEDNRYTMKSLDYERSNFDAFEIANDKLNYPVRFRLPIAPKFCSIAGSCDGLVCLLPVYYSDLRHFIVIWNPTTGACKEIQPPAANFDMLGFGYDPAEGDYKILASIQSGLQGKSDDVLIFTLKGESWREVCQMFNLNRSCGVYLNGCLHWLPTMFQFGVSCSILSFNLSEEKFEKVIPLPDGITTNVYSSLVVLRGCLCLHSFRYGGKCYIMEEYGLKYSWTEFELPDYNGTSLSYPLCIRSDGKVMGFLTNPIGSGKNVLYLYSAEDYSCQTASLWDNVIGCPCLYVESLVSP